MPKIVPVDMSNRGLRDWVKFPVLPHLVTHLYLNNNQLGQLPPDFFLQFTNLQWLDLRNNQLRDLPRKVPKEQRQSLCIKIENDASAKPAETTKTEESPKDLMLHTILLQNNALREVPDVLGQIPSLKVIQLHGNPCAPAYENFKNFMVQNTKPSESERSEELSETKSTKIIAAKRRSFSQTEPLLYQSMQNGCEVGGGVGKFFGPSLKKVRDVTLRRHNDRQRQLEQIQVDRQLQLTRDYEARANFRKTFHTRPIHARPTPLAPMGKDRDDRVLQKWQIQFGRCETEASEDALDQLSAEMDRVLHRRYDFNPITPSSRQEIHASNGEVNRILGEIHKAKMRLENN